MGMKMKSLNIMIILISVLISSFNIVFANEDNENISIRILLNVSRNTKIPLREKVIRNIRRELRSLDDVDIVKSPNHDYYLLADCMEIYFQGGKTIGYAMSFVLTEPIKNSSPEVCEIIKYYYKNSSYNDLLSIMSGQFLLNKISNEQVYVNSYMGMNSNLKKLCDSMVTLLDNTYLKSKREGWIKVHGKK